jgi:cytochrome d ubiquinol oxidase subunit II
MHLYDLPLIFVLIGLVLYAVLAGADFGAGLWQLLSGRGDIGARVRDHAHHAIGPVWEANHVWLVFVLTVVWTSYPTAFGSIASTLSIPLFIAAIGIVLRGAAYALRSAGTTARELRAIDMLFSLSSIVTPFALGTAIGAIAARRVPVGNAAGPAFSSWTGGTSILVGALAVVTGGYLAAVYLSADAARLGDSELEGQFRVRALASGLVSGAIALVGLALLRSDAKPLYHSLLHTGAMAAVIISALAGAATLLLVWRRAYEPARISAALAVAAIIGGWAAAQSPVFLPGLSVQHAAAPHDTLVLVVVAVIAGGAILFPSLALLFGLMLRGRFDHASTATDRSPTPGRLLGASAPGLLTRGAGAALVVGIGCLTFADADWAHAVGVVCLIGFVMLGFLALLPAQLAALSSQED